MTLTVPRSQIQGHRVASPHDLNDFSRSLHPDKWFRHIHTFGTPGILRNWKGFNILRFFFKMIPRKKNLTRFFAVKKFRQQITIPHRLNFLQTDSALRMQLAFLQFRNARAWRFVFCFFGIVPPQSKLVYGLNAGARFVLFSLAIMSIGSRNGCFLLPVVRFFLLQPLAALL